jgi:cytoskeletal protein CcmA (bactofilin family)
MFNKSKTVNNNPSSPQPQEVQAAVVAPNPLPAEPQPVAQPQRNNMMDIISSNATKPSILSEGFSFRGEISAKGAIHVEGSLNGQVQVDELTIGSRGQVEGVVTCSSLHIKGKFSGTATCSELIVTSSASVDGHVVYQTLSVQKGASIKGELLLVK